MTPREKCICGSRLHKVEDRVCSQAIIAGGPLAYVRPEPTPQRGDRMDDEDRTCDCWVRLQPEEDRFCIRFGAHNPTCPIFHPSLDPVDNYHDAELRAQHEVGRPHGTRDNMPSRHQA